MLLRRRAVVPAGRASPAQPAGHGREQRPQVAGVGQPGDGEEQDTDHDPGQHALREGPRCRRGAVTEPGESRRDGRPAGCGDDGGTEVKPARKSLWGYGGVVRSPDGTIWTVASSSKKDRGPATREIDEFVVQLGVADVAASKQFYVERGLEVAKSYGRRYVQFASQSDPVTLALYGRRALAKTAGVSPDGTGSHRIVLNGTAGSFTDPDGFTWESVTA